MWPTSDGSTTGGSNTVYIMSGTSEATTPSGSHIKVEKGAKGLSPKVYFQYVKAKFGLLEKMSMDRRVMKLQKLVDEAIENGQEALSEVFFKRLVREIRESELYAKGYRIFIDKETLEKFQYKVRGTSVSITPLKNYIKTIPKDILEKIKKTDKLFDNIVIVHYDPDKKAQKLTEIEQRKDPIVFGKIAESDRFYFIADWEDEYCDLTLDDIIDTLGLDQDCLKLKKDPTLDIQKEEI